MKNPSLNIVKWVIFCYRMFRRVTNVFNVIDHLIPSKTA